MHEENIEYIEQYLRENSQFPIEQLIATLKEAGYHVEDIEAAQARLTADTSEPESAESSVESLGSESFTPSSVTPSVEQPALQPVAVETLQHTMSPERQPKRMMALWLGIGACLVCGLAAVTYFFLLPDPVAPPTAPEPVSAAPAVAEPMPVPVSETKPTLGDVLAPYATLMSQGDYRMAIKADRVKSDAVPTMEEYTAYTRKGEVVRAEFSATPTAISILKNGKVFEIDTAKKQFREYDPMLAPGMAIADRMKTDFQTIDTIVQRSKSGGIVWVEQSGSTYADSEIESEQRLRVRLDGTTRMLTEISIRTSAEEAWRIISLSASPATNIDELMRFPLEYQKMTL